MNTIAKTDDETAALALLKSTGLPLLEAAQVTCAAARAGRGRVKRALRCIAAGEEDLKRQERTVTFEKAVEAALEARKDRRARTLCDFRYVTRRFMKRCPELGGGGYAALRRQSVRRILMPPLRHQGSGRRRG